MKIKIDFVTNSSSASFLISKKYLTNAQIRFIHSHIEVATMLGNRNNGKTRNGQDIYLDEWKIKETEDKIGGDTMMDNFDMMWFLDEIGVKRDHIRWEHSNDGYYGDIWDDE